MNHWKTLEKMVGKLWKNRHESPSSAQIPRRRPNIGFLSLFEAYQCIEASCFVHFMGQVWAGCSICLKLYHFTTILSVFGHMCINLADFSTFWDFHNFMVFKVPSCALWYQVGSRYKGPTCPIWVVCAEAQSSTLNVFSHFKKKNAGNWIKFGCFVPSFWSIQPYSAILKNFHSIS